MAAEVQTAPAPKPTRSAPAVEPLENGDLLTAREFMRRYEAMPSVKKAELIEGIVYMGSPVRIALHAEPDTLVQGWLLYYTSHTPGTKAAGNATVRLDVENVPQPDALLRVLPEYGGRSRVDADGYLDGPPELVVEIAASSASIDLRDKLKVYRRTGVLEYLIWRVREKKLDWLVLETDQYQPNPPDPQGIIHSRIFPGLCLDATALLEMDSAKVLNVLQAGLNTPAHADFVARLKEKCNSPSKP